MKNNTAALAPTLVPSSTIVEQKTTELNQLKQKQVLLQQEIDAAREVELKDLPSRLGFVDSADFIRSFSAIHNLSTVPPSRPKVRRANTQSQQANQRKPRRRITAELYAAIMSDIKAHKSKAYVMNRHDVSGPTYQNLKRDAGMTRPYNKQ